MYSSVTAHPRSPFVPTGLISFVVPLNWPVTWEAAHINRPSFPSIATIMVNLRRVGLRNLKWFGRGLGMGRGGVLPALNPSPPSEAPSAIPQRGGRAASRTAGGNQGSKPIRGVFIPIRRLGRYIGCRSIGKAPVSNPPGFGTRRARTHAVRFLPHRLKLVQHEFRLND